MTSNNIPERYSKPDKVGRYEILAELGRGGHAIVYRAYDPDIKRQVAIKVLKKSFLSDDKYRERFRREVQTVAKLEHPAIVPVYDFGEENDQLYIVMRLMSGRSLADRLNSEIISLQEAAEIITRLAPALDMAHTKGIIHRDLKPDNILFDQNNKAYIADFGIARIIEATAEWTTGIIGTPSYMSPEQVQDGSDIDGRSDIYSLGVILYQMLAGTPPFKSDTTPGSVFLMHIQEPVPDLPTSRTNLPDEINGILHKALAKAPKDRFSTAGELATALRKVVEAQKRMSSTGLDQKSGLRKYIIPGITLIFIIFVILGIGAIILKLIPGSDETPTLASPEAVALEQTFSPTVTSPTPISPTSTKIIPSPSSTPTHPTPSPTNEAPVTKPLTPEPTLTATIEGIKVSEKDQMVQVRIPEGEFIMGQYGGKDNPQHPVYLDAFWIDQTEITNSQYALCVAALKCDPPQTNASSTRPDYYGNEDFANYPVIEVSWVQAKNYCRWAGRDLPTEAQWEKAARGDDGRRYPWGNERLPRDLINYGNDVYKDTVEVTYLPRDSSFYNLLMMGGNVAEWVWDWYGETYYLDSADADGIARNPQGPYHGDDDSRVLRGSAWISSDAPNSGARVDVRYPTNPGLQLNYIGFRCAEPIP
jgi:serine/threonine-protein kinase